MEKMVYTYTIGPHGFVSFGSRKDTDDRVSVFKTKKGCMMHLEKSSRRGDPMAHPPSDSPWVYALWGDKSVSFCRLEDAWGSKLVFRSEVKCRAHLQKMAAAE